MPLDKKMSHEEMVAELIKGYKKSSKIGATEPRDMQHALEIANAVAYNLEESNPVRKVKEMSLEEMLKDLEAYVTSKEKELGIFSESIDADKTKRRLTPRRFMLNKQPIKTSTNMINGSKSEALENPRVKVTLDNGETFETEVDPNTSENDLKKQYAVGSEISVGREGQERKAKIKSATLTKAVGEDFELIPTEIEFTDEEENPVDVISLDVPLFLRLLEWAREDATEDVELHDVAERAVAIMQNNTEFLSMEEYDAIIGDCCTGVEPPVCEDYASEFGDIRKSIEETYHVDLSKNLKFDSFEDIPDEWEEYFEDSNDVFYNAVDLIAEKLGIGIMRSDTIETVYITFKAYKLNQYSNTKYFGMMEIPRYYCLAKNIYEVAELIQREIRLRYPDLLESLSETDMGDMGADQILPVGRKNKVNALKHKRLNKRVKVK